MSDELSQARERMLLLLRNVGESNFCRGCNAPIYWLAHRNGKRAPYNSDGTNHFITCPKANNFRKKELHGATEPAR